MSVRPAAVDFFARGTDNQIYHKFLNRSTSTWSDWGAIGGCSSSAPASSYRSSGEIDVFIRGCDGALWHKYWHPSTGWSGWGSLGGGLAYAPAAVSNNGTIDVFVTGTDGGLYARQWTGSTWTPFARFASGATSGPSAINERAGSVTVFAKDTTGAAGMTQWTGSGWTAWGRLGNAGNGVPTANAESGFVTVWTHSGDQLYLNRFFAGATSWTGWNPLALNSPWGGANRVVDTAAEADTVIAKRRAQTDANAFTVWDGLTGGEQAYVTARANATIPSSVRYGGANWKVDTANEYDAVAAAAALTGSAQGARDLIAGLAASDRLSFAQATGAQTIESLTAAELAEINGGPTATASGVVVHLTSVGWKFNNKTSRKIFNYAIQGTVGAISGLVCAVFEGAKGVVGGDSLIAACGAIAGAMASDAAEAASQAALRDNKCLELGITIRGKVYFKVRKC